MYNIENLLWGSTELKRDENIFHIYNHIEDGIVYVGLKNNDIINLRQPVVFLTCKVY